MPFLGPATLLLAVASVALSLLAGAPARPPAIAMDSAALLHVERAATTFAVLLLALVVIHRAFEGRLPDELSGRGVKYTPIEQTTTAQRETSEALADLAGEVRDVRLRLEGLETER